MKDFVKEFRDFINRGNVVDLAVAVVLGAAFSLVVQSFVKDILMQVIAAIGGQPDFASLTIKIGDGRIAYGSFINAVVNFVIIGFAIFLVVKAINTMQERRKKPEEEMAEELSAEVTVLTEIRDLLQAQRPV